MNQKLTNGYFDWLISLVRSEGYQRFYHKVLLYLFDKEFTWIEPMDENRAYDGLYLRDLYVDSLLARGFIDEHYEFVNEFEDKPCSILEMMIGLAYRCENSIMHEDEYGDRTGYWFWSMMKALGLFIFSDTRYNEHYVESVVNIFLDRTYEPNGIGGLFVVEDSACDLRTVEIWIQMQMYLTDILNSEGE